MFQNHYQKAAKTICGVAESRGKVCFAAFPSNSLEKSAEIGAHFPLKYRCVHPSRWVDPLFAISKFPLNLFASLEMLSMWSGFPWKVAHRSSFEIPPPPTVPLKIEGGTVCRMWRFGGLMLYVIRLRC